MTLWILLRIVAAVLIFALDSIWLMWIGRGFHDDEIGALLRENPELSAAGAFYLTSLQRG